MNVGARKRAGKLASRSRVFVERRRKRENARRRVVRKIFRPPESGCGTRRAKSNEQEQVERAVNAKLVKWGGMRKSAAPFTEIRKSTERNEGFIFRDAMLVDFF